MPYAYNLTDLGLEAPKPNFFVVIILIQIGYYITAYFIDHIYIWAKKMNTSTGIFAFYYAEAVVMSERKRSWANMGTRSRHRYHGDDQAFLSAAVGDIESGTRRVPSAHRGGV